MQTDLTKGPVLRTMLLFSLPMIAGNLLQQLYNVVDTLLVGRFLGAGALAAVGASFALMVFLTSVNLGLCMGAGAVLARLRGAGDDEGLKNGLVNAFVFIGGVNLCINLAAYLALDRLLGLLRVAPEIRGMTRAYLLVVLAGMSFTFLYNFLAAALRAVGNSLAPLLFLGVSALLNAGLDCLFILGLGRGVAGAAEATVISQGVSALCIACYCLRSAPMLFPARRHLVLSRDTMAVVARHSLLVSVQQSVMNFGILLVQGLVNSFGVTATAAFAAATKIDAVAYLPVQDFGNAMSTFIAQNSGAGDRRRIRRGVRGAAAVSLVFSAAVSIFIVVLAEPLLGFFLPPEETRAMAIGAQYLRIEGAFYCLIGGLFLLYGFYRGIGLPGVSLVLTVVSLGTRVLLSHALAPIPAVGLAGIWWSIPVGWLLADLAGLLLWRRWRNRFS